MLHHHSTDGPAAEWWADLSRGSEVDGPRLVFSLDDSKNIDIFPSFSSRSLSVHISSIRKSITQFREKQFGTLDAWILQVSVADDAPLGLRSFYIRRGDEIAYANGFIDVRPSVPDFNQDGLNDDFQRTFYTRWTSASAKPLAPFLRSE